VSKEQEAVVAALSPQSICAVGERGELEKPRANVLIALHPGISQKRSWNTLHKVTSSVV
jgi:hypothetical protein